MLVDLQLHPLNPLAVYAYARRPTCRLRRHRRYRGVRPEYRGVRPEP